MEKWNKPEISELNVQHTEAGVLGTKGDGVFYDVTLTIPGGGTIEGIMIGTSGPAVDLPIHTG